MSRVACSLASTVSTLIFIGLMQQPHRWSLKHQTSGMLPLQYAINSPQIDGTYADHRHHQHYYDDFARSEDGFGGYMRANILWRYYILFQTLLHLHRNASTTALAPLQAIHQLAMHLTQVVHNVIKKTMKALLLNTLQALAIILTYRPTMMFHREFVRLFHFYRRPSL